MPTTPCQRHRRSFWQIPEKTSCRNERHRFAEVQNEITAARSDTPPTQRSEGRIASGHRGPSAISDNLRRLRFQPAVADGKAIAKVRPITHSPHNSASRYLSEVRLLSFWNVGVLVIVIFMRIFGTDVFRYSISPRRIG
jgi:hypothetical protein